MCDVYLQDGHCIEGYEVCISKCRQPWSCMMPSYVATLDHACWLKTPTYSSLKAGAVSMCSSASRSS
jgi:hypothetical protein